MFPPSCRASALVHAVPAALIALTLLAAQPTARAQTTTEDPLVAQAEQLATRGDHAAALALLRIVVSRAATPRALGLLGLTAAHEGEPVESEAAVQRALAAPSDAWVAAHRRELNAALTSAARLLGTVLVEGVADGTNVRLAGRDVGAAPLAPTRVRAGEVLVEAGAARVTVTVTAGATVTAALGATSPTPTPATVVAPAQTAPVEAPEPHASTSPRGAAPITFGGASADAQIPASFTAAFPPTSTHDRRERSSWTDGLRLNAGLGLMGGSLLGAIPLPSWEMAVAPQGYLGFTLSGGVVLGVSRIVELAARLDVSLAPGVLDVRISHQNEWGWLVTEMSTGIGSLIAPTLAFDVRFHPSTTTPFYVTVGPRVGAAFYFARGESATGLTLGGELGIGTTLGADADWDLGLRVVAEVSAFSAFLTLDRRLF